MVIRASRSSLFAFCLGLIASVGCDKGEKAEEHGNKAAKADEREGDQGEASKAAAADDGKVEDEGKVVLTLGDEAVKWEAKRSSAEYEDNGSLWIRASVHKQDDESASRASLTLRIWKFEGPGEYVLRGANSNLTGVKVDLDDEGKATKEAVVSGISRGSVVVLQNAKVEVTSVTDDFIDGSFTWSGVSFNGPNKVSGTFHSRVKKD
ncbi:MAG: hypothetical protein R6X02_26410 [Enhygromyxa sp.]